MRTWSYFRRAAVVLILLAVGVPATAQGFAGPQLKVSAAASVERARPGDSFRVAVVLALPPETHINAHIPSEDYLIPTEVTLSAPAGWRVGAVEYPRASTRQFTFTPKPIAVYEGQVIFRATVTAAQAAKPGSITLKGSVSTQPCNAQTCFAPQTIAFTLPLSVAPAAAPVQPAHPELFGAGALPQAEQAAADTPAAAGGKEPPRSAAVGDADRARYPRLTGFAPPAEFQRWLERGLAGTADTGSRLGTLLLGGNWLLAIPLIFFAGLALNLTPCVYPLIPITIGFFGGQSAGSKRRIVGLAAFYVLGMALMYSTLGVAAALTGRLFGAQLQNPYVLVGFAAVMAALGLSMFGLWEFRLPAGLTSHVSARGGHAGALLMGLLVGIVAAPCIGPAVVALLQVVGKMGSPLLGFAVFFALALGLGTPYLILGSFSGLIQKLPRSGEWMNAVKHLFGLIMFWMALYYLGPLLGAPGYRVAIGLYTLGAGIYLLFFDASGRSARRFFAAKRGIGAVSGIVAIWFLLPPGSQSHAGIRFEPYSEQKIQQARETGRPVLIDFRADWCAACKELEAKTFSDPQVAAAARGMVALRKDLTRWDDAEAERLKREYGIVGLPNVVIIPPAR